MRSLLFSVCTVVFLTLSTHAAPSYVPSFRIAVDTNSFETLAPTNDVNGQANLEGLIEWIDDNWPGTAARISVSTNNWDWISNTNRTAQDVFDWLNSMLRFSTNSWSQINPSNNSYSAIFNSIDDNLGDLLDGQEIDSTGAARIHPTNGSIQAFFNAADTNLVTQQEQRHFIGSWSNQSFSSGPVLTHPLGGSFTNGPLRMSLSSLNTNLFVADPDGSGWYFGFAPRQNNMLIYMDFAMNVTRNGAASPRYALAGVRSYNRVSGAAGDIWSTQVMWDDPLSKDDLRINWSFMSGLSTANWYRIYFEHDFSLATNAPTVTQLGWYTTVIGTTATPTQ